jgi:hypothetical protein
MSAEDDLILRLRAGQREGWSIERQRGECQCYLEELRPLAVWAYSHYLNISGNRNIGDAAEFIEHYENSWSDFLLNAAGALETTLKDPALTYKQQLLIGWHCPEYPLWLPFASRHEILVLVARAETWMSSTINEEYLHCFRTQAISSKLPRALARRKPIFAMMDYCYEDTHSETAEFLGYPARTPAGLIQLAKRYDYDIVFLTMRNDSIVPTQPFNVKSMSVSQIIKDLNAIIEREILRCPARWLLWPSVDRRWVGVDYAA